MDFIVPLIIVFIVLCILIIWYITMYNKYQNYIIRINEAEANIDSTLRKRFDLLNKSISIIKTNAEPETEILDIINKLRSKKLTNFELDRQLYEAINEFQKYKDTYPKLKSNEGFVKIELSLNETEAEIVASRQYYNDIITEYNRLIKTFPSKIIASLCKYKTKTYFDGKNMEDKIINDFKL